MLFSIKPIAQWDQELPQIFLFLHMYSSAMTDKLVNSSTLGTTILSALDDRMFLKIHDIFLI